MKHKGSCICIWSKCCNKSFQSILSGATDSILSHVLLFCFLCVSHTARVVLLLFYFFSGLVKLWLAPSFPFGTSSAPSLFLRRSLADTKKKKTQKHQHNSSLHEVWVLQWPDDNTHNAGWHRKRGSGARR